MFWTNFFAKKGWNSFHNADTRIKKRQSDFIKAIENSLEPARWNKYTWLLSNLNSFPQCWHSNIHHSKLLNMIKNMFDDKHWMLPSLMLENLLTDKFKSKYWPSKLDSSQWIKIVFEETWMNPCYEICPWLVLLILQRIHKKELYLK